MAFSDTTINADNLYKGSGTAYFKRSGETAYRKLGYMQLVEVTPAVDTSDVFVAYGGERTKIKTFVNQTNASFGVTMKEWTAKNLSLVFGGTQAAAVSLSTTANIATNNSLLAIASLTGLVHGRRYFVSGAGLDDNTSFIFDEDLGVAGEDQNLDRPSTATTSSLAIVISAPIAFGIFDASQVTGSFVYVGDNNVGPPVRIEALNAILTPTGTIPLLDSSATDPADLAMTLDVFLDQYGRTAEFYWGDATTWVPA